MKHQMVVSAMKENKARAGKWERAILDGVQKGFSEATQAGT
jgi:hypothetical protein